MGLVVACNTDAKMDWDAGDRIGALSSSSI